LLRIGHLAPAFISMSANEDLNIDRIANLARLALTPEEKVKFSAQLADVLTNIEKLKQVNVDGVEPTAHAFPVYNVWADDVAKPGLSVEDALRNAPEKRDNMIVVPKVVE
jgi:aspartyl-tRNA(Asn)/glutamyl-tRNA(Gln) amidotransferase subunit C